MNTQLNSIIYLVTLLLLAQGSTCVADGPPLRLVGGAGPFEGRVEIFLDNTWGTICDDFFKSYEGAVVCRQLNYTGVLNITLQFGAGSGSILLDDVHCSGTETSLLECYHKRDHNCGHSEDVGVICNTYDPGEEGALQLVGGNITSEGRVEIFHDGEWGTVCDENWGISDAAVVCRQLGYSGALSVPPRGSYPPGAGYVWLYNVSCTGDEDRLSSCDHYGWGQYHCPHVYDANVMCTATIATEVITSTVSTDAVTMETEAVTNTVANNASRNMTSTTATVSVATAAAIATVCGVGLLVGISAIFIIITTHRQKAVDLQHRSRNVSLITNIFVQQESSQINLST